MMADDGTTYGRRIETQLKYSKAASTDRGRSFRGRHHSPNIVDASLLGFAYPKNCLNHLLSNCSATNSLAEVQMMLYKDSIKAESQRSITPW